MIVSLDDQLEWQESSKSHSPRTPSAPEALQSLRKNSPVPTPSRGSNALLSSSALDELTALNGLEALQKLSHFELVKTASIRGDYLAFSDGVTLPLQLILPLRVRTVERGDDGNPVTDRETVESLTVGSAWLSVIAEFTYESQLASLLRARKNLSEIILEDRRVLNLYVKGSLTLDDLKVSRLWNDGGERVEGRVGPMGVAGDSDDPISLRIKRKTQLAQLDERKIILLDQQNRLRKLLARELQRQHSSSRAQATPTISVQTSVPNEPISNNSTVSSAVSNMLKRFAPSTSNMEDTKPKSVVASGGNQSVGTTADSMDEKAACGLYAKLRSLQIEWYRVGFRLRDVQETEAVLERKVKRLRYERADSCDPYFVGQRFLKLIGF
jgi:hypothetical protein